jgi:hypothetical protein
MKGDGLGHGGSFNLGLREYFAPKGLVLNKPSLLFH